MATKRITLKNKKTGRKVTLKKKSVATPKESYRHRKRIVKKGCRA